MTNAENPDGADGAISIRVQTAGVFSFGKHGPVPQAAVGDPLYHFDEFTVGLPDRVKGTFVGKLEGLDGSDVWLRIQV